MSEPAPDRYRTLNWSSHDASLREGGSLAVWFDPSTPWHAAPSGKRCGQPILSDASIQAYLTIEAPVGLPLRQSTGFVASLLKLAGVDWPVPDVPTPCRRRKSPAVQLPCRGSGGPLHLLVDGTGITIRGEGREGTVALAGPRKPAARHMRRHGVPR